MNKTLKLRPFIHVAAQRPQSLFALIMQLPKPFRKPEKQESTAYSAVEVDADSFDTGNGITNHASPTPGWPAEAHRIASAPIWVVFDCLLLLLPIAFIGKLRNHDPCVASDILQHWPFLLASSTVKTSHPTGNTYKMRFYLAQQSTHLCSLHSEVELYGRLPCGELAKARHLV